MFEIGEKLTERSGFSSLLPLVISLGEGLLQKSVFHKLEEIHAFFRLVENFGEINFLRAVDGKSELLVLFRVFPVGFKLGIRIFNLQGGYYNKVFCWFEMGSYPNISYFSLFASNKLNFPV
jgi:hypothetical protein